MCSNTTYVHFVSTFAASQSRTSTAVSCCLALCTCVCTSALHQLRDQLIQPTQYSQCTVYYTCEKGKGCTPTHSNSHAVNNNMDKRDPGIILFGRSIGCFNYTYMIIISHNTLKFILLGKFIF